MFQRTVPLLGRVVCRRGACRAFATTPPVAPLAPGVKREKASTKHAHVKIENFVPTDTSGIKQEGLRDYSGVDIDTEHLLDDVLPESSLTEDVKEAMFRVASFQNASKKEILARRIKNIIEKYQRFPGDTGSTEVQVAVISERLEHLRTLQKEFKKDMVTKRAMTKYFHQRRKLMKYLKRERFDKYNLMLVDYNITEEEIWEWGHLPGRKQVFTRYPGAFREGRVEREKREKREAEEATASHAQQ